MREKCSSPPPFPVHRATLELRPIRAAAGLQGAGAAQSSAREHTTTAPGAPAHTIAHSARPAAAPRGVPASQAPQSALRAHPRPQPRPARGARTITASPRAPGPVKRVASPSLTRGAAQQQAQRPQQPHGAAAAPLPSDVAAPRPRSDPAPRSGHALSPT